MLAAEPAEGLVWGEKPDARRIFPETVSLKGEKALPLKQAQELPFEHEAETEEVVLKDTSSLEKGENNAIQLSPAEEGKSLKAAGENRFIESAVRNADEHPAPEKMPYNLSVQGGNAEKSLQNKTEGNPAQKTETAPPRKVRARLSSDTREARVGETPVTELVREMKLQTADSVRGASEQEISVDLRNPETSEGITERNSGARQAPAESNFGDMLSRQLNEGLSTDIVRHASIILRGNDSGLIRLTLKPETLGNVKIRLEMSENKIIGHIVVESREALRAFEEEVHVLEAAFKEAGFDGASLDMSLASGNGSGGDGRGERMDQDALSSLRIAASYDASSTRTEDGSGRAGGKTMYAAGRSAINMLV
jgi:flagellar hook-length control protein FliK